MNSIYQLPIELLQRQQNTAGLLAAANNTTNIVNQPTSLIGIPSMITSDPQFVDSSMNLLNNYNAYNVNPQQQAAALLASQQQNVPFTLYQQQQQQYTPYVGDKFNKNGMYLANSGLTLNNHTVILQNHYFFNKILLNNY